MNSRCVKGSCELINGVFFEKLSVLKKDSDSLPDDYIVTRRFECYSAGSNNDPRRLWFYKKNEQYKWKMDSLSMHSTSQDRSAPRYISSSTSYDTCPVHFEKNTWYTVRISDQRLRYVYLYVNKRGKFKIYQINSGVSPI